MSPPVPAWALSGMGLSRAALCQYWPHWETEVTLGTFFLHSELGEGSGRKEMQGEQGCAQGVVQATCGVWGLGNTDSRKLWFLWKWPREGTHPTGQVYSTCSVQSPLWPLSVTYRLSYFYGSWLLPTPELNALTLRSKWWVLPFSTTWHTLSTSFLESGFWIKLDSTHGRSLEKRSSVALAFRQKHPC